MFHNSGHKGKRLITVPAFFVARKKILSVLFQGDCEGHGRSHQIGPRFRHEGRVQAVALRNRADRGAKCLDLVRDADSLTLSENDRVLPRSRLMI